jgi:hypothetical protein
MYFRAIAEPIFAPFIAPQSIVEIGNERFGICTKNLRCGTVCIELKPKWSTAALGHSPQALDGQSVEDEFVTIQQARGYRKFFHPCAIFQARPTRDGILESLKSAFDCDKPYLKIHMPKAFDPVFLEWVADKLLEPGVRELILRMNKWSVLTSDFRVQEMAYRVMEFHESRGSKTWNKFETLDDPNVDDFLELGKKAIDLCEINLVEKWLQIFLTSRMVRDVSLMFTMDGHVDMHVIDTEIKPVWKILAHYLRR